MDPERSPPGGDPLSDEALVRRCQAGEVAAFDELVLRYKERLYGVLYNLTSNHEDTNDLLMETFDKAFRSLVNFKGDASFYTWIYRIGVNRALNHLEKRKRRRGEMSLNEIDWDLDERKEWAESPLRTDPERRAELNELQNKLNESLQKLSEEHRTVVVLSDIEGLTHAEIAAIVGCSEGTVKSRLHYGHKQLKKLLAGYLK
ncbi:MAG: sigma-70 family RNA polymerase sigma factor [Verrucomicrobiia bacterium]